MPGSSIAKVAIVLCYYSVFEKLIVSSKSLIEILEKFFECLETRTSKLEPRCSILKNFEDRGSRIEDRVSSRDCQLTFAQYRRARGGGGSKFRRRASAVPNLIAIRFDCSTAEVRLWFRRCTRVVPNSGFSEHCWRHVTILPAGTQSRQNTLM